jgi:hypothetical protein
MALSAVACTVAVAATNQNRILAQASAADRPSRIPSPTLPPAKSRFLHTCCGPAPWGPQIRSQPTHQITTDRQLAMVEPLASSQGAPNPHGVQGCGRKVHDDCEFTRASVRLGIVAAGLRRSIERLT